MPTPSRRKPVHLPPRWDWHGPVIIYVTVCTRKRRPLLARPEVHDLLRNVWQEAKGWLVGRYVVMPDHVHLFCGPADETVPSLERWVQFWKALASRVWPWPEEKPVWQRSFWDRQLRSWQSYEEKWLYVRNNPVRHGLVSRADDWPFAGELNELPWL